MGCMPNKPLINLNHQSYSVMMSHYPLHKYQTIRSNPITNKAKTKDKAKESPMTRTYLSRSSWLNILDYLAYSDIKEVGKINRQFNVLAKHNKILTKFFKKKDKEKEIFDQFYSKNTYWSSDNSNPETPVNRNNYYSNNNDSNKKYLTQVTFSLLQKKNSLLSKSSVYSTSDEVNEEQHLQQEQEHEQNQDQERIVAIFP